MSLRKRIPGNLGVAYRGEWMAMRPGTLPLVSITTGQTPDLSRFESLVVWDLGFGIWGLGFGV